MRKIRWNNFEEWKSYGIEKRYNERNPSGIQHSEDKEERVWYARRSNNKWIRDFEFKWKKIPPHATRRKLLQYIRENHGGKSLVELEAEDNEAYGILRKRGLLKELIKEGTILRIKTDFYIDFIDGKEKLKKKRSFQTKEERKGLCDKLLSLRKKQPQQLSGRDFNVKIRGNSCSGLLHFYRRKYGCTPAEARDRLLEDLYGIIRINQNSNKHLETLLQNYLEEN